MRFILSAILMFLTLALQGTPALAFGCTSHTYTLHGRVIYCSTCCYGAFGCSTSCY